MKEKLIEFVLDKIPFQIDHAALGQRLRIEKGSTANDKLERFASEAQAIANPKAYYKAVTIETRGDDFVRINGIKLTSRVLQVNLEGIDQVFLYAATCGMELEDWSSSMHGLTQSYWSNEIKGLALRSAIRALERSIQKNFHPGPISSMSPGSLDDWPLEEQRGLFNLIGDLRDVIGVQLLDTFWMIPSMSVSGVRFRSEDEFESCQLCPRENCVERAAPYDEGLYDRKYRLDLN